MILIADSGSTKTDWRYLLPNGEIKVAATSGINPNYQDTNQIRQALKENLLLQLPGIQPQQIYFYGAGCGTEAKCGLVANALHAIYPEVQIAVMSDVVAAARGTCGHELGIACILGTGSNSCLFDGQQITLQMPCLGFTLGNEGSGSYLGKNLIRLYLNNELPADLQQAFREKYPETPAEILQRVYNEAFPNRYLASFAPFLFAQQHHPWVSNLVKQSFEIFFRFTVCKYPDYKKIPAHFVGSVAFYFSALLKETAAAMHIRTGRILQSPMAGLIRYHQEQLNT
ncbi:MAG: N-acetylglucosamine kinase [Cytophagales bacterium CG18_big_fil_WC_8_21_14_2_50_42_9]|nr:MAG: N-acetylglucosamine kinase [Cytophagales bacterium CG18_big_fil_WC_8_21_14_2_50_42_9]